MKLYTFDKYGYNEPILLKELCEELNLSQTTIKQSLNITVNQGEICKIGYK